MDFFDIGDKLNYSDLNALVYLIRKFKRLTDNELVIGANTLETKYGTLNFEGNFTSVGGNFIIEDEIIVNSDDVLLNAFYTLRFNVIDVNTSGTVNRRIVEVTGGTGDDGLLELTIPVDLIENNEVILPNYELSIVFDEHEYYTPVSSLDITLEVDKPYIGVGETATVTATVLDDTGTPVSGLDLQFNFNGDIVTDTTDSDGIASAEYTGTGAGWVDVVVSGESIRFFDGCLVATVNGNSITLGKSAYRLWLGTVGNVIVDWGDGTTNTVNNPIQKLSHTYTDGLSEHNITFYGEVTSLGYQCFYDCTGLTSIFIPISVTNLGDGCFSTCTALTSVTIPEGVTSLGNYCFSTCTALTSVSIPNSVTSLGKSCFINCRGLTSVVIPYNVTSIGDDCFTGCTSLIDYELYWTGDSILDGSKMLINTNTVFTIPYGQTSNYIAKNYPSSKLVERSAPVHTYSLSIASDKQSILTSESVTISGTLLMDSSPYTGQSVALYDGSTLIDTLTTDSNGEYSKTLTGLSAGTHTFKAVNTNAESSTITVTVTEPTPVHNYSLSVTGTAIIQTGDSDNITATLTDNSVPVTGETLTYEIKHGSTVIDSGSDTTDTNGEISIAYTGTGVGDVSVIVSYGSLLQETFVVEDCWYYNTTIYSGDNSTQTLNVNLPNGAFTLEYDSIPTSRNNSVPYLDIGRDTNDRILIGQYARAGGNGIICYTGTSTTHALPNNSTLNQVNHYTFTYDGTNYKIDRDGENITVTGVGIHFDKIIHVEGGYGGSLQYIKVKAL